MAARQPFWKWRRWKSIGFCLWPPSSCIWNLKLKFQSKLDLCSLIPDNDCQSWESSSGAWNAQISSAFHFTWPGIPNASQDLDPPRWQGSWGQHGAHLGPISPRWAPYWLHKPCYQSSHSNQHHFFLLHKQWKAISTWHTLHLKPLRAKFFRGNKNIYLHLVPFLHTDMTQAVEILPLVRPELTCSAYQYHGCWCSGNARCQRISNHDIYNVKTD